MPRHGTLLEQALAAHKLQAQVETIRTQLRQLLQGCTAMTVLGAMAFDWLVASKASVDGG